MKRILCPLPDRDFDVTEVAVPWKVLRRAGHEVVFATEGGGNLPACDPLLLGSVVFGQLGADPEPKQFYAELTQDAAFRAPLGWKTLQMQDFDALLMPGGHAPGMKQYLGSAELQAKLRDFWALQRPVAAICHGVLPLARAGVLRESRTTSLTKPQERIAYFLTAWKLGRHYRTYPEYVEDEVKAACREYVRGPAMSAKRGTAENDAPAFVVEDGRYVSARWPGDAFLFAKRFASLLP